MVWKTPSASWNPEISTISSVRRSGTSPGLSGTLTGVADHLRGIAHSADSRRRPLASFAPAVRPHAAPVARQGSQASVLAMGSRSRHRKGRAQLEALQPLLARDLPMIEPWMGGEPQLRRTLPGSPINRPKCHGPTQAKTKSGSLSQNWHQGPKGINTFTPHKAPTQPTYGYEGVRKCEPFCSTLFTFLQLVRCT